MAKVTVLRTFSYGGKAGTRESAVWLNPGEEVEIIDELLPGLIKEGFVRATVAKADKPVAAAPLLDVGKSAAPKAPKAKSPAVDDDK